jgi:hypothetical protein
MKINLIPTKKLALLSAAFCAAMLAFTNNASAVTVLGDANELGTAFTNSFPAPPPLTNFDKTDLVNGVIGLGLGGHGFESVGSPLTTYELNRSDNNFGSLPTAVFGLNGTGATIPAATIGSGLYSYLFATYGGRLSGGVIYYIGNLSGEITIPAVNLIGWTLFGPGGVPGGVPDGGTTAMLLGAALGALGMARRFLKV